MRVIARREKKNSKGVKIAYDGTGNKIYHYPSPINPFLGQKLEIKHVDAVSERAEKYIKQYGSKYNRYIWEHASKADIPRASFRV